jgi:hypothetical protein
MLLENREHPGVEALAGEEVPTLSGLNQNLPN